MFSFTKKRHDERVRLARAEKRQLEGQSADARKRQRFRMDTLRANRAAQVGALQGGPVVVVADGDDVE